MKLRLILTFIIFNVFYINSALSQSNDKRIKIKEIDKKNIIKVNLLSPFMGTISIQHEKIINSESSIQTGLYFFSGFILNQQLPAKGICFTTEYRFYLVDEAPKGFYIQPYFRIARFWNNDSSFSNSNSNFYGTAFGMVLGKQWLFYDKFVLDLYGGPLFTKIFFDDNKISTKDLPPIFNGYWLRAGLTIGYYF